MAEVWIVEGVEGGRQVAVFFRDPERERYCARPEDAASLLTP